MWNLFKKKETENIPQPGERAYPEYAPPPSYQYTPPPIQPLPMQSAVTEKDLEIISAKLDAIKALLDSLNQRIAHLERIAREE